MDIEECLSRGRSALHRDVELAFVTGSVLAGLGTPRSDVDVFVVAMRDSETVQSFVDGVRVDVEQVSLGQLTSAVQALEMADVSLQQDRATLVPGAVIDLLCRFWIGRIIRDDGRLGALGERLAIVEGSLRHLRSLQYSVFAANKLEDAQGFHEVGAGPAELYIAKHALLSAVKSFVAAEGDLITGEKWAWAQWARCEHRPVGMGDDAIELAEAQGAVAVCRLTQDLLVQRISGYTYPAFISDEPTSGLRASSYVSPAYYGQGGALLFPGGASVSLSRKGLALWGIARGRSRQDTVELTASVTTTSSAAVASYLDKLLDAGLLGD